MPRLKAEASPTENMIPAGRYVLLCIKAWLGTKILFLHTHSFTIGHTDFDDLWSWGGKGWQNPIDMILRTRSGESERGQIFSGSNNQKANASGLKAKIQSFN